MSYQLINVPDRESPTVFVGDHARDIADVRGNHGKPRSHCLENSEWLCFHGTREHEDVRGLKKGRYVVAVTEYRDLLLTSLMRGNGRDGWFGWPSDPRMEELYGTWLGSADPAEQTRLEREYELQALRSLPFLPLGRYRQTSAWRGNVTGLLDGPSVIFWNVTKS